ncbi:MAG: hypothetical protein AAF703_10900 [Cyanobacteria bacterium P01_D01_bin.105]
MTTYRRTLVQKKLKPYILAAASWLLLSYGMFFLIPDTQSVVSLAQEDGLFEYMGAFLFLFSGVLFLLNFWKGGKRGNIWTFRNVLFLLLGLVFLFGFFEEISWGQRIFNIATPDGIKAINTQNELNFHNLSFWNDRDENGMRATGLKSLFTVTRLFSIFWFSFCCFLPTLYHAVGQVRKRLNKISFPVVPLSIGIFFMVNYLMLKVFTPMVDAVLQYPMVEVSESASAFLFFLVSLWFVNNRAPNRPSTHS